jgi:hypothetical protein
LFENLFAAEILAGSLDVLELQLSYQFGVIEHINA